MPSKVAPEPPKKAKSQKEATKEMAAAKPTAVVTSDPAGLMAPIMFETTHLKFIDEILGPAGRMTASVVNMLNKIVNLTENIKAWGARGKGSFTVDAEDDVAGVTKDLPRIKILDTEGKLVATVDCDAGVKIVDEAKWKTINEMSAKAQTKFTPQQLVDSLAEWFVYLNTAQTKKPDMRVGINTEQPFPQLFLEPGYRAGADWVKFLCKYKTGGMGLPCATVCSLACGDLAYIRCGEKQHKREVGLDEMLRRKKANSSKARKATRKNAKAKLEALAAEKKEIESKLAEAKDEYVKTSLESDLASTVEKLNDKDLKYCAEEGCLPADDEDWNDLKYKIKPNQWMFYPVEYEKEMIRVMTALQKSEDKIAMVYVKGVEDSVEKINLIISQLRHTFIKSVPYDISLRSILMEIKYELVAFAKELTSDGGRPKVALVTKFSNLFQGASPIEGLKLVDSNGADFTVETLKAKMGDAMQFVFNLFFNSVHPINLINVFTVIASSIKSLMKDSMLLGRKLMKLASQCAPPFPIIGRIQAEVAALVMSFDFKISKIPFMIVRNVRKFGGFPKLIKNVGGTSKGFITVLADFAHKDAPEAPMSESGYNQKEGKDIEDEPCDDSEMGSDYAASSKAAVVEVEIDEAAMTKAADGAEAEDAEEVDPDEAKLQAEAEKKLAEAESAPAGKKMDRD